MIHNHMGGHDDVSRRAADLIVAAQVGACQSLSSPRPVPAYGPESPFLRRHQTLASLVEVSGLLVTPVLPLTTFLTASRRAASGAFLAAVIGRQHRFRVGGGMVLIEGQRILPSQLGLLRLTVQPCRRPGMARLNSSRQREPGDKCSPLGR